MIDRLCALADMPKPRVGISEIDIPNAFATGRSPEPGGGLRDHRHPGQADAEELEAVLAHELSHVAHRDVLVMTVAASAGIMAGMLTRGAQYGAIFGRPAQQQQQHRAPVWLIVLVVSLVVYAISFFLLRLLSRYRELCGGPGRRLPHQEARRLASALQKITGEMSRIPRRTCAAASPMNAFFIAPAVSGRDPEDPDLDPPLAGAAARAAGPDRRPSSAVPTRAGS